MTNKTNTTLADQLANMNPEERAKHHAELARQLAAIERVAPELASKKKTTNRILKIGDKGGVYLVDPTFIAYSEKKKKNYVAGVNMNKEVFKALFGNPEIVDLCVRFAQTEMEGTFYDEPTAEVVLKETA